MLNGAGLLVRTLARLESVDLGYRSEHLSILAFTAARDVFPNDDAGNEVGKQLVRRLEAMPGVVAATPILSEPFIGQSLFIMKVARVEQPVTERAQNPFVPFEFAGPSYFRALGIPIVRGRGFTDADTPGSARVVVVNETLARQLWPNEDALGKQLVQATHAGDTAFTVVGVASDTRFRELRNVGPVVCFEWEQAEGGFPGLVAVRPIRPMATLLPAVRTASHDINPALVLWKTQTMDQLLDAPLAQPRLSALFLASAPLRCCSRPSGCMESWRRSAAADTRNRRAHGARSDAEQHPPARPRAGGEFGRSRRDCRTRRRARVLAPAGDALFHVSPIDPLTLTGVRAAPGGRVARGLPPPAGPRALILSRRCGGIAARPHSAPSCALTSGHEASGHDA